MKKKCYIAGKISGLPEEYQKAFKEAKKTLKKIGLIPISPIELKHDHDKTWESYMRVCLSALLKCDYVFTLDNWRKSPGAKIEVITAISLNIPIIHKVENFKFGGYDN